MAWNEIVLTIDAVDVTAYLALNSINVNHRGPRSTASFQLKLVSDSYAPGFLDAVTLANGAGTFFSGLVTNVSQELVIGPIPLRLLRVECQDWAAICDRRYIFKQYSLAYGGRLENIVSDIVTNYLDGTGITFSGSIVGPFIVEPVLFNGVTVTEAFRRLTQLADGWQWAIGVDKVLRWFDPAVGIGAGPANLTDASANIVSMKAGENNNLRANVVYAKTSSDAGSIWTDTVEGDGTSTSFPTTYLLPAKPLVFIRSGSPPTDVEQIVVSIDDIGELPYDFYYILGGNGVFQNPTSPITPILAGEFVIIKYPSPVSPYYRVEDAAQIAADGIRIEYLVERSDIRDTAGLQALADGELAIAKEREITIQAEVRDDLFSPGQSLTVNVVKLGVNDTFLVDQVTYRGGYVQEAGETKLGLIQTLSLSNKAPQRAGDMIAYQERLLDRIRTAQDVAAGGGSGSGEAAGIRDVWVFDSTTLGTITGTINGSNVTFNVRYIPNPNEAFFLFLNGSEVGEQEFYTRIGTEVTFTVAPVSGDFIHARYITRRAVEAASGTLEALARDFDAVDLDNLDFGLHDEHKLAGDMSIGVWVRTNNATANGDGILCKAHYFSVYIGAVQGDGFRPDFSHWRGITTSISSSGPSFTLTSNEWRYLGLSINRSVTPWHIDWYLGNGSDFIQTSLDAGFSSDVIDPSVNHPLLVGEGGPFFVDDHFEGDIADQFIWNRKIAEAEHLQAMLSTFDAATPPPLADLVHWVRMGDNPEVDKAPTGSSGTVNGTTLIDLVI